MVPSNKQHCSPETYTFLHRKRSFDTRLVLAARHLAGAGLGRNLGSMAQTSSGEPPKRGMHRTVTGSHMDLSEMENLISGASTRGQETETSSLASSSQTGRSNIIQVCQLRRSDQY